MAVLLGSLLPTADGTAQQYSELSLPRDPATQFMLEQVPAEIEKGNLTEVTEFLGNILAGELNGRTLEDAFLGTESGTDASPRGVRIEVLDLLAQLSPEGRQAYQTQFGVTAEKMLLAALESGDWKQVGDVSRKFFHTRAGYEATLLRGRHELDLGRPAAAAYILDQLRQTPAAARQMEPILSVLTAACWMRDGREEKARRTLLELKQRLPDAEVRIAGASHRLFVREADALSWLRTVVGRQTPRRDRAAQQWALFRGAADRNAAVAGDVPLFSTRWRALTTTFWEITDFARERRKAFLAEGIAALPAAHPLAVGDWVIFRSARKLQARDFSTGKLVWESSRRARADNPTTDGFDELIRVSRSVEESSASLVQGLEHRLWDDATYGTLSSDGRRVYAIEDLQLNTGSYIPRELFFGPSRDDSQDEMRSYNRLAAYDLKKQGAIAWEIDGGLDEELGGAFFLGAPLPVDGRLYVLAEIRNAIRLLVLDAASGELVWQQRLANVESGITRNPLRRRAGAWPSLSDGVLVCPTSAGAAIGVDVANRSLRWAYQYEEKSDRSRRELMFRRAFEAEERSNNRWIDSTITIAGDRAMLTPVESSKLHCVNLRDGSKAWEPIDRRGGLYVACVHDGKIVVVGHEAVWSVRLDSGEPVWTSALPAGSLPSGRGFYTGEHYVLPLTSGLVLELELEEGSVVDRAQAPPEQMPGNLVAHRGMVISQNVDTIYQFAQRGPLEQWTEQALAADPQHPEALLRKGELLRADGELPAAVDAFRRAYQLAGQQAETAIRLHARLGLIQSLLKTVRQDFSDNLAAVAELEKLLAEAEIPEPEFELALLQVKAAGLQHLGRVDDAFAAYLKLVDLDYGDPERLLEVEPQRLCRMDRWLQSQLTALYEQASESQRNKMDAEIAARLSALDANSDTERLRQAIDIFGRHSQAADARQLLARRLLAAGELVEAQLHLLALEHSQSEAHRRAAVALQAHLLKRGGQSADAARYCRMLLDEYPRQQCLDGKTGEQVVQDILGIDPQGTAIRAALSEASSWGAAVTRVERKADAVVERSRFSEASFPRVLNIRGPRGPFFEDMQLLIHHEMPRILGRDRYGRKKFEILLFDADQGQVGMHFDPGVAYARAYGHLLVVSTGYRLYCVSPLAQDEAAERLQSEDQSEEETSSAVLWEIDLTEASNALSPRRTFVQSKFVHVAGRLARERAEDGGENRIGVIGPLTPHGVTYLQGDTLICLDPASGETIWRRSGLPVGAEIFGGEELLYVARPASRQAMVVRSRDGVLLGQCEIPREDRRMAEIGGQILALDNDLDKLVLSLVNPWEKNEVWSVRFPAATHFWYVPGDAVAVMQPDGNFQLLALDSGKPLINTKLRTEPNLSGIHCFRDQDRYLLFTNHPATMPAEGVGVSPIPGGFDNPMLSSRIYSFDARSGKPLWHAPAVIEQRAIKLPLAEGLPALVFVQNRERTGRNINSTKTTVLCIDKRTGTKLFEDDTARASSGETFDYHVAGNPEQGTISIALPQLTFELTLGNAGVPPEPPFREGKLAQREKKAGLSIFDVIPGSLRPKGKNDPFEADDDLFGDDPGDAGEDPFAPSPKSKEKQEEK